MKSIPIISIGVLCTAISISANASDLINISDFPEWFQEAMVRESGQIKTSVLSLEQLNVNTEVLGKYTLNDDSDGTWYYTIDIGSPSPVECYVFTSYDGPATSLYSVVEYGLSGIETLNNKKLVAKNNYSVAAGVIGDAPYLALDTLYTLESGGQRVIGVLKAMSAQTDQSLQICMHNELGYRESFYNTFVSFVNAFSENQANAEFFEAISKVSINGIPMGFLHESYTSDADGDISVVNNSALMVPVDASSIARTDSVSRSWSKIDGTLINSSDYTIENGTVSSQFSIVYQDDAWQVEGEMQGKAISTQLEHKGELLSGFGSYVGLASLRNSDKRSQEYFMWAPSADPTSVLPVVLSQIDDNESANFEIDMGPMVLRFLADDKGIFRQGNILQGPMTMQIELLYSKGQPLSP